MRCTMALLTPPGGPAMTSSTVLGIAPRRSNPARPSTTSTSTSVAGASITAGCVAADRQRRVGGVRRYLDRVAAPRRRGQRRRQRPRAARPAPTGRSRCARSTRVARPWSIWWLDGRNPGPARPAGGRRLPGRHRHVHRRGHLRGQPILVRFLWSDITAATCRWEQAFSPDGGTTWEVNWIMEFTGISWISPAGR